jgi:uncharacterized membrane protein YjgN (DUF898 family)
MLPSVAVPTEPSQPSALAHRVERFSFHGSAAEYFRIWLVNLALTIATLGVYSAWAKVRTQRYFYGNTWVAGAPFEYLARPMAILKGRLIAASALAVYLLGAQFLPAIEPVLLLALSVATPWVVVRSLAFRAHNSAWRGLRFRFAGDLWEAYSSFLFLYLMVGLSFGLLYPWLQWRQRSFVVEGHRFAGRELRMNAGVGAFYRVWATAVALTSVVTIIGLSTAFGSALLRVVTAFDVPVEESVEEVETPLDDAAALDDEAPLDDEAAGTEEDDSATDSVFETSTFAVTFLSLALLYAAFLLIWVFVQTRMTHLVWNATSLGPHRFESSMRARAMIWLYVSNTVAVLASAGLLIPWARIRMARYRAEHLSVLPGGSLDGFVGQAAAAQGAAGAEMGELFDLDLGF